MALNALLNRHTIRNYDQSYQVPEDVLNKIIEAARISPTAYGIQDVDYVVCSNKATNQKAADAALAGLPEANRNALLERKKKLGVTNVITCDAPVEIILYANERKGPLCDVHAGITAMSIMVAAKEFDLDTMPHVAMISKGADEVYGIPPGSSIVAVALGLKKPDAYIPSRTENQKVTFLK